MIVNNQPPVVQTAIHRCKFCGRHLEHASSLCCCQRAAPPLGNTMEPDYLRTKLLPENRSCGMATPVKAEDICPECGTPYSGMRRRCYQCHPGKARGENYRPRESRQPAREAAKAAANGHVEAAVLSVAPGTQAQRVKPQVPVEAVAHLVKLAYHVAGLVGELPAEQARAVTESAYWLSRIRG